MRQFFSSARARARRTTPTELAFLAARLEPPAPGEPPPPPRTPGHRARAADPAMPMYAPAHAFAARKSWNAHILSQLESEVMARSGDDARASVLALLEKYCEQLEFRSARALLLAQLALVGSDGVRMYLLHSALLAGSPSDVRNVYEAYCANAPRADVAAVALAALAYLGDSAGLSECRRLTARFWDLETDAHTLLASALDYMLNGSWGDASDAWHRARALGDFPEAAADLVVCLAARYYLLECPDVEAVQRLLVFVEECGHSPSAQFTALVFSLLAPMHRGTPMREWVELAAERAWPVSGLAAVELVRALRPQLPDSEYRGLSARLRARLAERGVAVRRNVLLDNVGKRITAAMNMPHTDLVAYLQGLRRRGVRPPFGVLVNTFSKLLRANAPKQGTAVVDMMRELEFPIHCVETDFAMMAHYCRSSAYAPAACDEMLQQFFAQYPIVSLDLPMLTQIGWLLYNCGRYEQAVETVDNLRARQYPPESQFSSRTYDCRALLLLVWCRFKLGQPLVPFVRGVLADSPGIFLDAVFKSKLRRLLLHVGEDRDVLDEIDASNTAYIRSLESEVEYIASQAANAGPSATL